MNKEWMKGTLAPEKGKNPKGKFLVIEPRVEIANNGKDQQGKKTQCPETFKNKTTVYNVALGTTNKPTQPTDEQKKVIKIKKEKNQS